MSFKPLKGFILAILYCTAPEELRNISVGKKKSKALLGRPARFFLGEKNINYYGRDALTFICLAGFFQKILKRNCFFMNFFSR
jgi:hypothetical protein